MKEYGLKETIKHWFEVAKFNIDPFIAKRIAVMSVVGLVAFAYMWGILFGLMIQVDGALVNPVFIAKAWSQGLDGPYLETATAILMFFVVLAMGAVYQYEQMGVHGRARFGDETDIKRAKLYADQGLLLGRRWLSYLCADVINGDGHLWVYAPSGSGKGTGFLIPNLLNWKHSAIVLDLKREIFNKTSGFRAACGHKIYMFDPSSKTGDTVRFNPFDFIERNPLTRISDIKNITELLWPTSEDKGEIWQPGARSLFVALVLYMMDTQRVLTFGNLMREVKLVPDFAEHIENILDLHFDDASMIKLDPVTVQNFTAFLQQASKEQSGVLSSIKSGLEMWEDPILDAATSATDFDLRMLRKERMTIYVGISLGRLKRLKPLLNMFFQQCLIVLTEKEPDESEPYRVLMALDEFPMLGRLEAVKDGISFLRSYGVRMMIVCQSKVQVADTYDINTARIFAQNCKYIVAYAPNDHLEAQEISDMLGRRTVKTTSRTYSNGNVSTNVSLMGRELMTADEVRLFTRRKSIILAENMRPIKARKVNYLHDRAFKKRLLPAYETQPLDLMEFKRGIDAEYERAALKIIEERKKKDDDKKQETKAGKQSSHYGTPPASSYESAPPSYDDMSYNDIHTEFQAMSPESNQTERVEPESSMDQLDERQKEALVDLFDDYLGE